MLLKEQLKKKAIWKSWLPGFGVFEREVRRFFAVPAQTILAPVGSSLIYFGLFGFALGKLITNSQNATVTHGFSYLIFLIPGIMAMEVINAGLQNPMSSIMIAKWSNTVVDILMAPITPFGMWMAYISGAIVRTLIVSAGVFVAGSVCAWQFVPFNPVLLFLSLILSVGVFGSLGVAAGAICKSWDQIGIIMSFIVQPLVFFSGVFFSFHSFPEWLQFLRFLNPIFYIVSMFRYSILGIADTSALVSFSISFVFAFVSSLFAIRILKSGFGLRV